MVQNVDAATFLANGARLGLSLDTRYGPPRALTFGEPHVVDAPVPQTLLKVAWWIPKVLHGLHMKPVYLWRRGGSWTWTPRGWPVGKPSMRVSLDELLICAGVRPDAAAVRFETGDHHLLAMILLVWGGVAAGVQDDLFLVPADGEYYLHFDHDGVIRLVCRSEDVLARMSPAFLNIGRMGGLDSIQNGPG